MIANLDYITKLLATSVISRYQIAKESGVSAPTLQKYADGKSKIENMSLINAIKLTKCYENHKEEIEMDNKINEIITAVENGKLNLVNDWTFHEVEYTDGASDIYIEQDVEGNEEITMLFAEFQHIKELREDVYQERKPQSELDTLLNDLNGLDDQFNYDKVVGYRVEGGPIVWL